MSRKPPLPSPVTDLNAPHPDLEDVLVSADRIATRVAALGGEISRDYAGQEVLMVCVLKGSFMFFADLCRHLTIPVNTGFIAVASYGNSTRTSGVVRIVKDLEMPLADRHVILVEDIVDTGLTISYLLGLCESRMPASLKVCSLLSKPSCRRKDVPVHYCGFEIPDRFVIGYGLDYHDYYRNLPYVGVLKREFYADEEH